MTTEPRVKEISRVEKEEDERIAREQRKKARIVGIVLGLLVISTIVYTIVFLAGSEFIPLNDQDLFR